MGDSMKKSEADVYRIHGVWVTACGLCKGRGTTRVTRTTQVPSGGYETSEEEFLCGACEGFGLQRVPEWFEKAASEEKT